jgi:outer membrane protein
MYRISRLSLSFSLWLFLSGCELAYEPAFNGDAPSSPGSEAHQRFSYKERVEAPYTSEDLTKTMALSKLLDIALYNNPTTRASWNAARAAAFSYRASLSDYYPSITYFGNLQNQVSNGSANVSGTNGSILSSTSTTTSSTQTTVPTPSTSDAAENIVTVFNEFTLSYLLLDFGGRYAQSELAWQMLVGANWEHNLAMQQVMIAVINAYTSYLSNKSLVVATEQDLKDAQVALDAALKMRQAGLATLTDVLSAQSAVEQARFNLAQAKGNEKTALADLLITLGLPPETHICVEELPDKLPVIEISGNICSLIELAKQKRPDIGAAIAAVREQQAELLASFSAGMPTVTLNGSYSHTKFLKPVIPSLYDKSIELDWNWPLFSGFFYVNQQKQIRAQIDEARATLDATVAQVVTAVATNYYAFTTAEAELPSSEAVLEYSQRAYGGMLSQYKVGTASIIDVLTALTTLSNARAQLIMVRTQWAASLANLAFSVGILGDDSGTWMDAPPKNLSKLKYKDKR